MIVSIYVDDVICLGSDRRLLQDLKFDVMKQNEMSDLGLLHNFLGKGVI